MHIFSKVLLKLGIIFSCFLGHSDLPKLRLGENRFSLKSHLHFYCEAVSVRLVKKKSQIQQPVNSEKLADES